MADLTGFECVFLRRRPYSTHLALAADYWSLYRRTRDLLRQRRPRVLWMQLPPMPLLWAALRHRQAVDPCMKLVADCHNATFKPRWALLPFGVSLLKRCDLVVVHNAAVTRLAREHGVPQELLFELEDVPALTTGRCVAVPEWLRGLPRPWIVFPGSFSTDEPVAQLLAAARDHPQWTFVMTGAVANARRHRHDLRAAPGNVVMPGYLDPVEFDRLLSVCDLMLALTREDGVQLSACNEALGFGKPMVVSDTPLLRSLFSQGALMVDSRSSASLGRGIAAALARLPELEAAAQALAELRRLLWRDRFAQAPAWLRDEAQQGAR